MIAYVVRIIILECVIYRFIVAADGDGGIAAIVREKIPIGAICPAQAFIIGGRYIDVPDARVVRSVTICYVDGRSADADGREAIDIVVDTRAFQFGVFPTDAVVGGSREPEIAVIGVDHLFICHHDIIV